MNNILKTFMSMSFSGSLLILTLIVCKPFFKNKISRRWQYYIWLIVIARLLLPFTPETNLTKIVFDSVNNTVDTSVFFTSQSDSFKNLTSSSNNKAESQVSIENKVSIYTIHKILALIQKNIWLIWLMIAVILFIRKMTIYQSFMHYIKSVQTPISDTELLDTLATIKNQLGIKKVVELCVNPFISSPMLIGFFHPYIVLPDKNISNIDFRYTMLHELAHYRNYDMFYKWLVQITVCLHWFNPIVYLMANEINNACELSCDEAVISKLDYRGKQEYGKTLLNAMRNAGRYKEAVTCVTLSKNKKLLKERLDSIMKFKRKSKITVIAAFILTILFSMCATVAGAYVEKSKSQFNRILKEDNVYYIMCDGVSESDKPTGGATDGYIGVTLVKKDSYISFGIYNNLNTFIDEITEQCKTMVKEKYITQNDAELVIEAAKKIQLSLKQTDNKIEEESDNEYSKWGIQKIDGAYYYQNQRIRIFIDLRANNSFKVFKFDKKFGSIDIRLLRDKNGSIVKLEYISEKEVSEILENLDIKDIDIQSDKVQEIFTDVSKEENPEDISRISIEDIPDDVQKIIESCDSKKWYVVEGYGRQYIYYNNLPYNYAFEYDEAKNNLTIVDIGKSKGNYVLLSVAQNDNLKINYNSNSIQYIKLAV